MKSTNEPTSDVIVDEWLQTLAEFEEVSDP